jgi:hypothetical protein
VAGQPEVIVDPRIARRAAATALIVGVVADLLFVKRESARIVRPWTSFPR